MAEKSVLSVLGTRPNIMKIAPIDEAFKAYDQIKHYVLHTGQHYDSSMSDELFEDLELREADFHLGVGSGQIGEQTGRIMIEFEKRLLELNPDLVIVVGDVNSTLACALVAVQHQIPVAHVESGLRSFDRRMPEEINRLGTDAISDYLFTTHPVADKNLKREGVLDEKIFLVGDIMIDPVVKYRDQAKARRMYAEYGVEPESYGLVTLHRPSNVDNEETLARLVQALRDASEKVPLIFPVHPRTRKNLERFGLWNKLANADHIQAVPPVSYLKFLSLLLDSKIVLTDSGGIQEETTFLNIPCLTLRENTERPFTITDGTNCLVGTDPQAIAHNLEKALGKDAPQAKPMHYWDGKTGGRIAEKLNELLNA